MNSTSFHTGPAVGDPMTLTVDGISVPAVVAGPAPDQSGFYLVALTLHGPVQVRHERFACSDDFDPTAYISAASCSATDSHRALAKQSGVELNEAAQPKRSAVNVIARAFHEGYDDTPYFRRLHIEEARDAVKALTAAGFHITHPGLR